MGLDNGIRLVTKQKLDLEDWEVKPDYVTIEFDEFWTNEREDGYYYDICYWRKCWDLRGEILHILKEDRNGQGYFQIDKPEQVEEIMDAIVYFLKNPDEWRNSIWTIDEMLSHLAQNIINLSWLKKFMEEHPTAKVDFYDSY